jgi:hypothetical protein
VIPPAVDRIGLRATPVVFAAVFALGVWAEPIDLFGVHAGWVTRAAFAVACVTSLARRCPPPTPPCGSSRSAPGMFAAVSRGLTILVIGQDLVPRKSELIGGSVWMATGWMVFAIWVLTIPAAARWQR